jgi:hypothetical protein
VLVVSELVLIETERNLLRKAPAAHARAPGGWRAGGDAGSAGDRVRLGQCCVSASLPKPSRPRMARLGRAQGAAI